MECLDNSITNVFSIIIIFVRINFGEFMIFTDFVMIDRPSCHENFSHETVFKKIDKGS